MTSTAFILFWIVLILLFGGVFAVGFKMFKGE